LTTPKRIPPWERAQLNFQLGERTRERELRTQESKRKDGMIDLEENRKRLAEIRKRLEEEKQK
jgi:hypothetical protein